MPVIYETSAQVAENGHLLLDVKGLPQRVNPVEGKVSRRSNLQVHHKSRARQAFGL